MVDDWPPKFTLDQGRILRLFIGDAFYSSADAGLREAILNAIDACARRKSTEASAAPFIRVTFDLENLLITVEDNGDGMGRAAMAGLYAKVGASASELAASDTAAAQSLIGTFGIGVISYFMLSDEYNVETKTEGETAIGLTFSTAMLDGAPATEFAAHRVETGTSLALQIKTAEIFEKCLQRFPHWVRDVEGLSAVLADGSAVHQGGPGREVRLIVVTPPDWVETAHIGPPTSFSVWDSFDGRASVDVLYRGVYVESARIDGLWGIAGSVHVDPKHFRPKLNREGFVGDQMLTELTQFLRDAHPIALLAALDVLREAELVDGTSAWTLGRWASMWLAIPRTSHYEATTAAWDAEFAGRPAFRLLEPADEDSRQISIQDIQGLSVEHLYVAPVDLRRAGDVVRQAARALVARGEVVIQGVLHDSGFLSHAPLVYATTSDLMLNYFRDALPDLIVLEDVLARELVQQQSLFDLFLDPPLVRVVQLGTDGAPVAVIQGEIWINLDTDAGKLVLAETCDRNDGLLGLWVACLLHAPQSVQGIAGVLRNATHGPRLGPVLRQRVRRLVS